MSERWKGDLSQWDEFQHNALGMLTQVKTYEDNSPGGVTCEWDFDRGGECQESTDTTLLATDSYSWDAVGNPSGETVSGGRLTTLDSMSFTYDADGNITQRTGGGETVTYWWNSLSQLDSANSSVDGKVRYEYDGFGRRVSMNDATGTTHFLWDGDDVVADINSSGNATRFYNYYPGMSNIHSMVAGTDAYLYLKDLTGNVLGLQNESGTITNTYEYSPFGELVSVSEGVANRFRFASGEQDRLGLYYFRARYYDPEYMRFISEDPIGLAGGINPYVYAANNPIDFTDPTGLCEEDEDGNPVGPDGESCVKIEGLTVTADKEPRDDDTGGGDWEPGGHPIQGSGPVGGGGSAGGGPGAQPDLCDAYGTSIVGGICRRVHAPQGPEKNTCVAQCLVVKWNELMDRTNGAPTVRQQFVDYVWGDHPPCYSGCGYSKVNFVVDFILGTGSHARFRARHNGCSLAVVKWGICGG